MIGDEECHPLRLGGPSRERSQAAATRAHGQAYSTNLGELDDSVGRLSGWAVSELEPFKSPSCT